MTSAAQMRGWIAGAAGTSALHDAAASADQAQWFAPAKLHGNHSPNALPIALPGAYQFREIPKPMPFEGAGRGFVMITVR